MSDKKMTLDRKILSRISFFAEALALDKIRHAFPRRPQAYQLFCKIMPEPLAASLEYHIHELSMSAQYPSMVRKYYNNLSPKGYVQNQKMSAQFLQGRIHPKTLLSMSNQDLFPARYEGLLTDDIKFNQVHVLQDYRNAADGIVKCSRCKSWKTEYTQKQTRSADEPATNFVVCLKCQHRFRFC